MQLQIFGWWVGLPWCITKIKCWQKETHQVLLL